MNIVSQFKRLFATRRTNRTGSSFQEQPEFGAIAEGGRVIAVASARGDFMFADVSEFDQGH